MGKNIVIAILAAALVLAVVVNVKQYNKNNKLIAQLTAANQKVTELENARPPFMRGENGEWKMPTDENGNPIRPPHGNFRPRTDENGNPVMPPNGGQRRRGGNRQGGRPNGQAPAQLDGNQPALPQLNTDESPELPLPELPRE